MNQTDLWSAVCASVYVFLLIPRVRICEESDALHTAARTANLTGSARKLLRNGIATALLFTASAPEITMASSCGPGINWVPSCPTGTYTLGTELRMDVVYTSHGFTDSVVMSGTADLYIEPANDDMVLAELVNISLSGGGYSLLAGDGIANLASDGNGHSGGFFYDDVLFTDEMPFYNAGIAINPALFTTPYGTPDVLPFFDLFSEIDQFPPLGTEYWIWQPQPFNARAIFIPDFDEFGALEGIISKDLALTALTFTSMIDFTSAVPLPPALWLFGSGLLGLVGVARRKKASYPYKVR